MDSETELGDAEPSTAIVDWIGRLIALDTTSRSSNLQLIAIARDHLERNGFSCRETLNAEGTKANLFATLAGSQSASVGGVILSGHTDTVPVDGQNWTTEPFGARFKDGRVYGRGACDMKGFIAVVLALASRFRAMPLRRPLHIALSYDEELGCIGAPFMIDDVMVRGFRPALCIVGEPTMMTPVVAHKAIRLFRCAVEGKPSHSSRPSDGVNAVQHAIGIGCYLRAFADRLEHDFLPDHNFDPPFSTMVVTKIAGGTAVNIVPEHCEIAFECRILPRDSIDMVEQEVRGFIEREAPADSGCVPQARARLHQVASVPGLSGKATSDLKERVLMLLGGAPKHAAFASEAGQFEGAGIPTLICGPGSIEQAHQPDEWVTLQQLAVCEQRLLEVAELALI